VDGIRLNKGFEFESKKICSRRGRAIFAMGVIFVALGDTVVVFVERYSS